MNILDLLRPMPEWQRDILMGDRPLYRSRDAVMVDNAWEGDAPDVVLFVRDAHAAQAVLAQKRLDVGAVHLWHPENLDGVDALEIPSVIVTSSRAIAHGDELTQLHPSVASLNLNGTVVAARTLDPSSLTSVAELVVSRDAFVRGAGFSPSLRALHTGGDWGPDAGGLASATGLCELSLLGPRGLKSLAGIAHLTDLRTLRLARARTLTVDGLRAGPRGLERLWLQVCHGIDSLEFVDAMQGLGWLFLDDCGDIASVQPLTSLPRLESLGLLGSTRVVDGDLAPLLALADLRQCAITPKRHYSPPARDVCGRFEEEDSDSDD